MTKLQQQRRREWRAQIKRLKAQQRRMEKRGYRFFSGLSELIPETMPERVTKRDIDKLKAISARKFYQYAHYVDSGTGEVITGFAGRRLERSRSAQRGARTRATKDNFFDLDDDTDIPVSYAPLPPPPVATSEEFARVLLNASQLAEYGGWIRDDNRGSFDGSSYRHFVRYKVTELQQRYRGLSPEQRAAFWEEMGRIIESYYFSYESGNVANVHQDTVSAFRQASEQFRALTAEISYALTRNAPLTL